MSAQAHTCTDRSVHVRTSTCLTEQAHTCTDRSVHVRTSTCLTEEKLKQADKTNMSGRVFGYRRQTRLAFVTLGTPLLGPRTRVWSPKLPLQPMSINKCRENNTQRQDLARNRAQTEKKHKKLPRSCKMNQLTKGGTGKPAFKQDFVTGPQNLNQCAKSWQERTTSRGEVQTTALSHRLLPGNEQEEKKCVRKRHSSTETNQVAQERSNTVLSSKNSALDQRLSPEPRRTTQK